MKDKEIIAWKNLQISALNTVSEDYSRYIRKLEKENAKAKELLKKWQQADICDAVVLFADTEEFLKEKL